MAPAGAERDGYVQAEAVPGGAGQHLLLVFLGLYGKVQLAGAQEHLLGEQLADLLLGHAVGHALVEQLDGPDPG